QHAPQHAPQPAQRIPMAQPAMAPRVGAPAVARPAGAAPVAPAKPQAADEDAISLVEDTDGDGADAELLTDSAAHGPSKIKFGADIGVKKHDWKRQLKQGGMGASRV